MKLSEDRINAIAHKIAFELVKKRYIRTNHNLRQVSTWVEKPILEDLHMEERINNEVLENMRRMTTAPPEGSFAWQSLYQKKREELAQKYGYEL